MFYFTLRPRTPLILNILLVLGNIFLYRLTFWSLNYLLAALFRLAELNERIVIVSASANILSELINL